MPIKKGRRPFHHLKPQGKKPALLGRRKAAPFNSNVEAVEKPKNKL